MAQFSIHLTQKESELMHHTAADPVEWIDNLVEWRVRIAEDAFLPQAIDMLKAAGATSIPGTRDEIIMAAPMPPKDPNWTPVERDLPNDDRVVYTFDLEPDDIKMLAWMWENPHQHIHDLVVERAQIAIKEKADIISKELLADPTWTDPIPLDPLELLELVELKTVKEHMEITSQLVSNMVEIMRTQPDYIPPPVHFHTYKHHKDTESGTPT